jgi:hypothetical protein
MKRTLAAFLALLALPLFAETPPRNWGRCPAVIDLKTTETVYALGDTHGDYDRLVTLLVAGKLLAGAPASAEEATWSGGKSILVITGDMIDKWNQSLDVIALLRALTSSAATQGGRVVISSGNHEAEFLDDPTGSKTKDFRKELEKAGLDPKEVAKGEDSEGIGKFLLCLPFGTRVNDWFFAHAGSTKGRTFEQLTRDLMSGFDDKGYAATVLLGEKGLLEARMSPAPWWEKKGDQPIDSIMRLQSYADALGVDHIVFGHQPGSYDFNDGSKRKKGKLFENFDGLVFLMDMGMSEGVNYSKGALLRIQGSGDDETATALFPDGTQKQIWP